MVGTTTPLPPAAVESTSPVAQQRRRPTFLRWGRGRGLATLLIALPGILVFTFFSWIPIARSLFMAFQKTNFVADASWVGWANFTYVLNDPTLPLAVRNTLWFTVLSIVIGFPLPLFLAVFMAELRRRRGFFTVLAYLPTVIPPIAAILLWRTFYDPSPSGTFNQIAGLFGLGPYLWLNSPEAAMPLIVIEATWASFGGTVIIYIAALVGVRTELYEAAELDGAGIWRRVWHVTIPQLRGIIIVLLLLQIIGVMQVFSEPYVFTGGGPNNATVTVLMLIFRYAFERNNFGAATALSVMLAVALGIVSLVYHFATRKLSQS